MHPKYREILEYSHRVGEPVVAIFDIGTRAVRLLLAPRRVPLRWEKKTFWNEGWITNLGSAVDARTDTIEPGSAAFHKALHFIEKFSGFLERAEIAEVSMIGTAVFRWLQDSEEVLSLIQGRAGFDLQIIPEEMEARLTIQSLAEVLQRRGLSPMEEEDTILVMDQGGGSLEVSWMRMADRHLIRPRIGMKLADELGTVSLRQEFFTRDAEGELVEAHENRMPISRQMKKIGGIAKRTIGAWKGLPRASTIRRGKLRAFAVGTAATKVWPNKNNFDVHGEHLSIAKIDTVMTQRCEEFDRTKQQVLSVYKALHGLEGSGTGPWKNRDNLDRDLTMLYGLPVYRAVLEACELDHLTVSGYGLRYAYYLDRYSRKMVEPDDTGPFLFISYSHINPHHVYDDLFVLNSRGYRVWYDRGLRPSADWTATLASKIKSSSALMVFLTKHAIASDNVFKEVFLAHRLKKQIIPVLVGISESDVPERFIMVLGDAHYISKASEEDDESDYYGRLVGDLPPACNRNNARIA